MYGQVVPGVSDSASGTKNKNHSVNVFIGRKHNHWCI